MAIDKRKHRQHRPDGTFASEGESVEVMDPKQVKFLNYWLDPESETYGNITQSGIKAGFSESYARNLTSLLPDWLSDSIEKYADRFDDEYLYEKHKKLLDKEWVVSSKDKKTGEVTFHKSGEIDPRAVKDGLDMAYKIKGTYSPEKHLVGHVTLADIVEQQERQRQNARNKG